MDSSNGSGVGTVVDNDTERSSMTNQETKEIVFGETPLSAIKELMLCFEHSTADEMKLSVPGLSLKLSRGKYAGARTAAVCTVTPQQETAGNQQQAARGDAAAAKKTAEEKQDGLFITAPVVGTYYAASAPQNPPFVVAGDRVYKGQTVCMMEAMKMLSEIPAPCDCVIEEILKADGELAEYGEALFRYRPC